MDDRMEMVEKYKPQIFYFDWCIEQPAYEPYMQRFASCYYNRTAESKQENDALFIEKPSKMPCEYVLSIKIGFVK
jgi:alpha-L-fucosidase